MKKLIAIDTLLALCLGLGFWACDDGGNGGGEDARPEQVDPTDGAEEAVHDPVVEDVPPEQPPEQPAEEQQEAVGDPQPDEVVDVPEDTPEEGDGVTEGACMNAADQAIITGGTVNIQEETTTCAYPCFADPDRRQCITDCLVDATDLSPECADCFGGIADCTIANCMSECMNPESPECGTCREENGCTTDFADCSGLPA